MYPGAGCWFHPPECWPEWCPGKWAGLQKGRVCSCLWPCRRASMERQVFTDLFTPQQMGKNRWEGGEWGNRGFGASHIQCVISLPSTVLLLAMLVCLLSPFILSDSDTPWTAARQVPLSCLCLLRENEQWLQSSNLTLSVVSWKHRMWFYRWNFVQYGPQEASQHLQHCMAREGWSEGGWEQIKGLLGDQQCVRPGPPLQPHPAVFISTCQCSHINPIYFRTGMTQVSFL